MRLKKPKANSGPREVRTLEPPSANRPSGMCPDYRLKHYREVKTALGYFSRQLSSKQTV